MTNWAQNHESYKKDKIKKLPFKSRFSNNFYSDLLRVW